jgi:hypothetical protein
MDIRGWDVIIDYFEEGTVDIRVREVRESEATPLALINQRVREGDASVHGERIRSERRSTETAGVRALDRRRAPEQVLSGGHLAASITDSALEPAASGVVDASSRRTDPATI